MKRLLVVLIVLILVSGGLAGCASSEFEVSPLTTTPTSAPETAPDVVPEKVKDIETIMGRAEKLGVQVESISHKVESITLTCQADSYTTFRDYLTALEESGRFITPIPPPEGYPYTTGGTISLEPKFQYIDMPAVYHEVNRSLSPLTVPAALELIVGIARENGINVNPGEGKFSIPAVSPGKSYRTEKMGESNYRVLSVKGIKVQGDYEDVMAFISDLDSRKTLRTMILTRVVIGQIEAYGGIGTVTTVVDVDIYTIES